MICPGVCHSTCCHRAPSASRTRETMAGRLPSVPRFALEFDRGGQHRGRNLPRARRRGCDNQGDAASRPRTAPDGGGAARSASALLRAATGWCRGSTLARACAGPTGARGCAQVGGAHHAPRQVKQRRGERRRGARRPKAAAGTASSQTASIRIRPRGGMAPGPGCQGVRRWCVSLGHGATPRGTAARRGRRRSGRAATRDAAGAAGSTPSSRSWHRASSARRCAESNRRSPRWPPSAGSARSEWTSAASDSLCTAVASARARPCAR